MYFPCTLSYANKLVYAVSDDMDDSQVTEWGLKNSMQHHRVPALRPQFADSPSECSFTV